MNLYEIFVEQAGDLGEDIMRSLLNLNFGILEAAYQKWMDREDGFYDELNAYVCDELELISEIVRPGYGSKKEDEDGTGYDQAA